MFYLAASGLGSADTLIPTPYLNPHPLYDTHLLNPQVISVFQRVGWAVQTLIHIHTHTHTFTYIHIYTHIYTHIQQVTSTFQRVGWAVQTPRRTEHALSSSSVIWHCYRRYYIGVCVYVYVYVCGCGCVCVCVCMCVCVYVCTEHALSSSSVIWHCYRRYTPHILTYTHTQTQIHTHTHTLYPPTTHPCVVYLPSPPHTLYIEASAPPPSPSPS
jgi:hypothetical protein